MHYLYIINTAGTVDIKNLLSPKSV